jgi:hypothetical protein
MCIIRKDLERDGIDHLSQSFSYASSPVQCGRVAVSRKVELYQIFTFERLPCDWICAMLLQPLAYDFDIEYCAFGGADWMLEGQETRSAKVEGQSPKGCPIRCLLGDI